MNTQNGFKKWERITNPLTIEHLFINGQKDFIYPYKIFYDFNLTTPLQGHLEMAIAVPKKRLKKAHDRNRIKRLTREAYRTQKSPLISLLATNNQKLSIFMLFVGNSDLTFTVAEEKINLILTRLQDAVRGITLP